MLNAIQLRQYFMWWLMACWSITAWAAQPTFSTDMGAIPIEAFAWTIALSFIGGAAFTANKISRPNIVVKSVPLEVVKDLLMAVLAGIVTFFLGSWAGIPNWLQAAMITIAGYGGSKVLDKYLAKGLDLVDNVVPNLNTGTPNEHNRPTADQ